MRFGGGWVIELDVERFFDTLNKAQLQAFVRRRVRESSETGAPQGGSISPLAANLYMHYVFDLWAQRWRRTAVRGDMVIVRYLDDWCYLMRKEHILLCGPADIRSRYPSFWVCIGK